MWTFQEEISGRTLWPRRRMHPGEGGLGWHMSLDGDPAPLPGDSGLLTGTREEIERVARHLRHLRSSRSMESAVRLVEIGEGE